MTEGKASKYPLSSFRNFLSITLDALRKDFYIFLFVCSFFESDDSNNPLESQQFSNIDSVSATFKALVFG